MTIKASEGHAKAVQAVGSVQEVYTGGKVRIFSAPVPVSPGGAETGTLLAELTNGGLTVAAKQKIRFTPVPGTANGGVWSITLNGVSVSVTDDGSATPTEICTALYNSWRVASGLIANTTPASTINSPKVYQKFAFTDGSGYLDVESSVAGVPFKYSADVTGAGAGTGSWTIAIQVADAYGLQFEDTITTGYLTLLETMTAKGKGLVAGQPAYFRMVATGDTGGLSTTEPRMQGVASTSVGSDMKLNHATIEVDEPIQPSTLRFKLPYS